MKMAPVIAELSRRKIRPVLVHTGQHYDYSMSEIFIKELEMPEPDYNLECGPGSHAEQTAKILTGFESICVRIAPKLVIVGGDVNSTLACALAAAKLNIPVAHIESGLRSFDFKMPEEINRILTDHLAELLFTTEPSADENLLREGISGNKILQAGDTMVDTLFRLLPQALAHAPWSDYGLTENAYILATIHRPSNVDDETNLKQVFLALDELGMNMPVVFPAHPRTQLRIRKLSLESSRITIVNPMGYLDFLGLMARARVVITDSGGVQEETTALGIPCVTVRRNTERPITISHGTNSLSDPSKEQIIQAVVRSFDKKKAAGELWDGKAAFRIVDRIEEWAANNS